MAAIIGLTIASVMLTLFPIFSSGKLQEIYSFIPLEDWGPNGTSFNSYAKGVKDYGPYIAFVVALIISWIHWSINNWVGASRNWADQNVVLYRVVRDLKGALFLATMSTLTRKRGNIMYTLRDSLTTFATSVRSKWLRCRIEEIVDRVDMTRAIISEAFDTTLLSKEMYYFLRDTQEASGFADGFAETGRYVEESIIDALVKRMTVYRWLMLLGAMCAVIAVMAWQFSVINEMRSVMQSYYSSK
jgi:type II secretory pathway component PulF